MLAKTLFSISILALLCNPIIMQETMKLRNDPPFETIAFTNGKGKEGVRLRSTPGNGHFIPYRIYFKGEWHEIDIAWRKKGDILLDIGKAVGKKSLVSHADPRKEVGNQPPSLEKMPTPPIDIDAPVLAYYQGRALYYSMLVIPE